MYDTTIIGVGIVGAMTVRLCSRFKGNICILEKESDVLPTFILYNIKELYNILTGDR